MKQQMIIICPVHESMLVSMAQKYQIHLCSNPIDREHFFKSEHAGVEIVLTNGSRGITAAEIERLPDLKIIGAYGAGYENIDVSTARAKGIVVTHGPGTNSRSVADHAMALMLAAARRIIPMHGVVQQGGWSEASYQWPSVYGKRLGILGLGRIGMEIAKRAKGFDLEIGYTNRSPRGDVYYTFHADVVALAAWSDYLICACPGGAGTQHLINAAVLENLGPEGIIVNIGRGSVVDTDALVHALKTDVIAGAGLDVLDGEPVVPPSVIGLANLTLSPHVAGRAPETGIAKRDLFLQNVALCLSGQPVETPVPDS